MSQSKEQVDFDRLFDFSTELLCVAGYDGFFKRLNPAWEKVLGISREVLMSAPYLDFVHPDDRALTATEAGKIRAGASANSFENRYRCGDGSYKWLLWSADPVPEQERIFASAHDITAFKQAEQRLAVSYAITRVLADSPSLADAAPRLLQAVCETLGWEMGVFWQVDSLRNEMHCRILWNAKALSVDRFAAVTRGACLGLGSDLAGRAWLEDKPIWLKDVLTDLSFPRAVAADESGLHGAFAFPVRAQSEVIGVMEFFARQILRPDKYLLYLFDSMGSQIGQFAQRRRIEQQVRDYAASLQEARREQEEVGRRLAGLIGQLVRARQEAEDGTRAKSEFLARMSHEIRTPMTAIMGMTELALGTPLTAEQREYLETVDDSAKALLRIVNDILDFSKIEARRLELDRTDFSLRDAVESAVKTMTVRARQKNLDLVCRIRRDVPDSLFGDSARLRQILLNLIANAIKFTRDGGVTIRVQRHGRRRNGVALHFAVADTGVGVPPELQNSIFDSFTQADESSTRRYGGTGLGLTIAAQLVALMGGRIWVESVPGQGSTFQFTARFGLSKGRVHRRILADLRSGPQARAKRQAMNAAVSAPLSILVAEDNAVNQRLILLLLEKAGHRAVVARNGEEAVSAARRRNVDLVLMDVGMPVLSGLDATRAIRASEAGSGRRLPIIAMTAHALKGDRERCLDAGMDAYLSKPIQGKEFYETIRRFAPPGVAVAGNGGNASPLNKKRKRLNQGARHPKTRAKPRRKK
jgi:PAS domain S-box-containing protein